jgi:hypothetical protein
MASSSLFCLIVVFRAILSVHSARDIEEKTKMNAMFRKAVQDLGPVDPMLVEQIDRRGYLQ